MTLRNSRAQLGNGNFLGSDLSVASVEWRLPLNKALNFGVCTAASEVWVWLAWMPLISKRSLCSVSVSQNQPGLIKTADQVLTMRCVDSSLSAY